MKEILIDKQEAMERAKRENEDKQQNEFNWLEETAQFGFDEEEEVLEKDKKWQKSISQKVTIFFIFLSFFFFFMSIFFLLLPSNLQKVYGYSLIHISLLCALLCIVFLICKGFVHVIFIFIRDNITENRILHNRNVQIEISLGIWFFSMLPIGSSISSYIPWAKKALEKVFICGILSLLTFFGKNLLMEMFKTYFFSSSLKDKACDIEIKERIINKFREYCYGRNSTIDGINPAGCFLANFFSEEEEDNPNENIGMEFLKGDMDNVVGDLFTTSIFQKKHLIQREVLELARDTFIKCSKDKKCVSFNDFCKIFSSEQEAVQAFLYFDKNKNNKISKKEMRDTLGMFHYDRKNLERAFRSLKNFVNILDNMASIVISIPLLFMCMIVFGFPVKELIAFSLSSALILNFFISGVAKDFYLNCSFIITHPFDIGDEVIIDGKDYTIYSSNLYKTEVLSANGGKIVFMNKILYAKNLINMTRAPHKLIHLTFDLSEQVNLQNFKKIKDQLLIYFRKNNKVFYETFTLQSESESSSKVYDIKCTLIARCKYFNGRTEKLEIKIDLSNYLRSILDSLNPSE